MSSNYHITIWGVTLVAFFTASGCHCVEVSERYGDMIDRSADRGLCLDKFYRPGLDLTRICRDCIHQEAAARNTGFYANSSLPTSAPVEPVAPAVPPAESIQEEELIPPVPVPPVPATLQLPVIDINNLQEISDWSPGKQPATTATAGVLPISAVSPVTEPMIDLSIKAIPPVDHVQSVPQGPIAAPAAVPPSQRFLMDQHRN